LGGWLSVASIIQLMAEVGVDEAAVRSAVSRLKRRGILIPRRDGGAAGYALSPPAHAILEEGDRRIFRPPRAVLADGWVLAVFSVPESERYRRHQLRSRLAGLGFGTVAPGVWIAPVHVHDEVAELLRRTDLAGYVDLFRASHLDVGGAENRLGQWWDLDRLRRLYQDFLDRHGPVMAACRRGRVGTDRQAFGHLLTVLTDWRRLPYADPGLPVEWLPAGWVGTRAADAFLDCYQCLAEPARRFAHSRLK
jgi:phenylacetic acid degradation operon negative regulatory protein